MSSQDTFVSVIVPTYKEAGNIPLLVPRICEATTSARLPVEVIIVDDNSQTAASRPLPPCNSSSYRFESRCARGSAASVRP